MWFWRQSVADTGKAAEFAQSHAALSSLRTSFPCSVAILRDPQLSSCFAPSVSVISRAGFVACLLRSASSQCETSARAGSRLGFAGLRGGVGHLGPLWRLGFGTVGVRGRGSLGCRRQPRNTDLQGTLQTYLLFAVILLASGLRDDSMGSVRAPEIYRCPASLSFTFSILATAVFF